MDSLEWNDDLILDFSVEESRRRRSVVTGESDEVGARVKVRRRSTDEDDRGEDEDENVEIIGECPGGNRQSCRALVVQSSPLVRSAFCPMKIDHTSDLTLYPGYQLV